VFEDAEPQVGPLGPRGTGWDDSVRYGRTEGDHVSLPATQARLDQPRSRWPWLLWGLASLLVLAAITLYVIGGPGDQASTDTLVFLPVVLLTILGYSTVGAILASRNTRNPMGWIMLTVGLAFALAQATETYAKYTLEIDPGVLPFGAVAAWFGTWDYAVAFCALLVLAQLYPSGRVLSPRWRKVPWIVVAAASVASVGTALSPGTLEVETGFAVDNPFGLEAIRPIVEITGGIGWIVLLASVPVSIASLVLRFRRSEGESRQQIRWLAFIAVAVVASLLLAVAAVIVFGERFDRSIGPEVFFGVIFSLIGVGVPAAMGVAVLKYRLYDLDLVIKKTIVFAILVLLLLALVGVGALLLGGTLVPSLSDRPPLLVVFGVVFGLLVIPAYRLARRIADRVVYGGRASPYEVLSEFSERASETYSTEDVLPRMAQLIGQATGADSAHVWLHVGSELRPTAAWPSDAIPSRAIASIDGELPPFEDQAFEIRHQGELLGALTLRMRASDPMNPSKERIVRDLASQTGLVLRNVRLIEELRGSRRRIVKAQDEERRRLERNIHDGAQQQLVALSVKLGLAERLIPKDPAKAVAMLAEAKAETGEAIEDLRDLARGIYPPVLADRGLVAALEGQARKSAVAVVVESEGIGRYPQETEAAVYFSCLEALQNVAKYAEATAATVRLAQENGSLTFAVSDSGRGFDPATAERGTGLQGIADRLASLGGELDVRSAPGDGTTVAGRLPVIEESR
jgi:signal transduction histidine kinase